MVRRALGVGLFLVSACGDSSGGSSGGGSGGSAGKSSGGAAGSTAGTATVRGGTSGNAGGAGDDARGGTGPSGAGEGGDNAGPVAGEGGVPASSGSAGTSATAGTRSGGGAGEPSSGGASGADSGAGGESGQPAAGSGGSDANGGSGGGTAGSAGLGGTAGNGGTTAGTNAQGGSGNGSGTGGSSGAGGASGSAGTGGTSGSGGTPSCSAETAPNIDGLGLATVVHDAGLGFIVYASQPPGSDDWYLVDQRGRIRVWSAGTLSSVPFLDLTAEVELGEGSFGGRTEYDDRGLVGMTFAPDYETSGLFYIAFIPVDPASPEHEHRQIREYRRSANDPFVAEPTRVRTLLDVPTRDMQWANIHHASTVLFGPDGMLYTALGDGGTPTCNAAEPNAPQQIGSPFGKVLRLDPTKTEPPYAADGNPFAATGDPRVLHYGLRNPFRFNFDSLTGDLFVSDVGQSSYEEINYAPWGSAGQNFGWAAFEGYVNTCPNRALRTGSTHTPPIFAADRRARNCSGLYCDYQSAVSGTVYRGDALPELYGAYLFGDVYGDRMNLLYQCGEQTSPLAVIRKACDPNFPDEACFEPVDGSPAITRLMAIVEGTDRELYLVANRNRLLKVVPPQ